MGQNMKDVKRGAADPLIDEVRRIRRSIWEQFGNDVDRLCDHLEAVSRDYDERRGAFSGLSAEAAAQVVASWGEDAWCQDDPVVDGVRDIRGKLADRP